MRIFFILICSVFLLAGCTIYHIDSEDITLDYYPAKSSPDQVDYVQNISRPHEVIGYVMVNTERRQQERAELIEKLKKEAAVLGGDAITNIETDATGLWKKLPAQRVIGNAYVRANFKATVIVYK